MSKRATGRYERTSVGGEEVAAFVPHALPPADPPIVVDAALAERLRAAEQALVRLGLAGEMVPSLDWFIYAFVRKEAVLSSQIEGTQATLVDLLTFEAQDGAEQSAAPNADVEEVCNYLDALAYARAQLGDPKGLPLSMRLLACCPTVSRHASAPHEKPRSFQLRSTPFAPQLTVSFRMLPSADVRSTD